MSKACISDLVLFISLLLICPSAVKADPAQWQFQLEPYAWLAGVSGSAAVRDRSVDFDASFSDVFHNIDFTASGRFEAVYNESLILTADLLYLDLGQSVAGSGGTTLKADLKEFIGEFGGGYRFPTFFAESSTPLTIDLLAGARVWYYDIQLSGPFGRDPSQEINWVEPFIGPRLKLAFLQDWSLNLRSDFGGFDIGDGSKFVWTLFPAIQFRASELISIDLGYKILAGEKNGSKIDLDQRVQGLFLGAIFHF